MRPQDLKASDFASYPVEARTLVTRQLDTLRVLPLSFLPLLLRETITYDWKFPAERKELDDQFRYLSAKTPDALAGTMRPFGSLHLEDALAKFDWVNDPVQFSEKLSAFLWATHQIEEFRKASIDYVHALHEAMPEAQPPAPRLVIILMGQQVQSSNYRLFRKLQAHGVHHTAVAPEDGLTAVREVLARRAQVDPRPFDHWYIDGGTLDLPAPKNVATVSFQELQPARVTLVQKMIKTMRPGGGGPELLRTQMAELRPSDLNLPDSGPDGVLSRFKMNLLTQGSGTQIFSTTFVQWAAREVLRRAQPVTLVARFAPRQRDASVGELRAEADVDAEGALIDADMAAYYTWINQQRLTGANNARLLAWFEGHNQALVVSPNSKPGTTDSSPVSIRNLVSRVELSS